MFLGILNTIFQLISSRSCSWVCAVCSLPESNQYWAWTQGFTTNSQLTLTPSVSTISRSNVHWKNSKDKSNSAYIKFPWSFYNTYFLFPRSSYETKYVWKHTDNVWAEFAGDNLSLSKVSWASDMICALAGFMKDLHKSQLELDLLSILSKLWSNPMGLKTWKYKLYKNLRTLQ